MQEVAAARHTTIRCGHADIGGYTFHKSLKKFNLSEPDKDHSKLQALARSICYLLKAVHTAQHGMPLSGAFSLNIAPLRELLDKYRNRSASEPIEKIYALLGMASDDPGTAGLFPDYTLSWSEAFQRATLFCICANSSVETRHDQEHGVIQCEGFILGRVQRLAGIELEGRTTEKELSIVWNCEFGQRNSGNYQEMAIEDDDVVCLPRDEVHPLIIRAHEQHWAIVSTLTCDSGDNVFCFTEEEVAKLVEKDPANLLLVWDWQSYPRNSPVSGYRPGHDTNDEYRQPVLPGYLNRGIRKLDFALSLYMVQSTLKFVSIVESVEQLLKPTLESREAIDLGGYQSEILELIGQQKYGWAALGIAVEHGHKAVVKLIIHRGEVDLNSKDAHFAETPLSQAARCG